MIASMVTNGCVHIWVFIPSGKAINELTIMRLTRAARSLRLSKVYIKERSCVFQSCGLSVLEPPIAAPPRGCISRYKRGSAMAWNRFDVRHRDARVC